MPIDKIGSASILRNRLNFKSLFVNSNSETPALLNALETKSNHPVGKFLVLSPEEALTSLPAIV